MKAYPGYTATISENADNPLKGCSMIGKELKKFIGGINRYGLLRAISGLLRLLQFKVLKPRRGTIVTITDKLIINFEYPKQFMGSLVVFRELVEPEYQFLRNALCRDSVFFDVGGGIGNYSLCAAQIVRGPIHTFEPLEENIKTIRANLEANMVDSKVRLNPVALSAKEGFGHIIRGGGDDAFVGKLNDFSREYYDGSVDVTTIDSYCTRNRIHSIDVLKIDVEGHEREVVEGGDHLIRQKSIQLIILETDHRLEKFYKSLQKMGFVFFYYDYKNNSLIEIFPICEITLLNEPSVFSSNIILIRDEKIDSYRGRFNIVFHS